MPFEEGPGRGNRGFDASGAWEVHQYIEIFNRGFGELPAIWKNSIA